MDQTCEYCYTGDMQVWMLIQSSPDEAQICSCHNVTKGDVVESVRSGTCKDLNEIKACTKGGTGCGGCIPLIQSIMNKTLKELGQDVSNHCMFPHRSPGFPVA